MINKRVITSVISLMFVVLAANAQKGGKYGANPKDSVRCVEALSVYVDFMKSDDYKGAFKYWVVAFDLCPKSSLKMYVDGVKMYKEFIDTEADDARKQQLIDTMILIHKRRYKNFGDQCNVYGRLGYYMYKYDQDVQKSFNIMDTAIQVCGNEAEAATLIYYFKAATDLERKEKLTKPEVVNLYTKCIDIVAYNVDNAKSERVAEGFSKAEEYINKFAEPYLSCEVIVNLVNKGYEKEKDNVEWMAKMADLLDNKECTETPTFFKVANRLHQLAPSAESANKMGVLAITSKKYDEAKNFFSQAIELVGTTNNEKKSEYEFNLSKTYFSQGQYSAARTHALNAAGLKANWGAPYLLIGDMYAASKSTCPGKDEALGAVYWAAIDKYQKAKAIDPSVTEDANKKIATYSQYFPMKRDAFFYDGMKDGDSYTLECWIGETTTVRLK